MDVPGGLRAAKRKCVNVNGVNLPLDTFTLSKMSRSERQELEMRLRGELEQVQMLNKRILSRTRNDANVAMNLHPRSKHYSRREASGRFAGNEKPQLRPCVYKSNAQLMQQCGTLLKRLMSNRNAWVFNFPVDPVLSGAPDYFDIIKHPMDLQTINNRLTSGAYCSPWEFHSDVMLTFTNAKTYNPPHHEVHKVAITMCKAFERGWKPIEKKLAPFGLYAKNQEVDDIPVIEPKRSSQVKHNFIVSENMKPKMTVEERLNLKRRLLSIKDFPDDIYDFFRLHNENKKTDSHLYLDIDSMNDDKLFVLRDLLEKHVELIQSGHEVKTQSLEVEFVSESENSEPSNSPVHPSKGSGSVDEDVDIGGRESPVACYPPVEIEKDEALKTTEDCSSGGASSSSSSDSGSSSSDSGSSSSSGSESDTEVTFPNKVAKECGPSKGDIVNLLNAQTCTSGLDLSQQFNLSETKSIDPAGHQEGENVPNETHVSPGKLHRAAYLKSRFADTIFKAREKTLEKGGKSDPEKLQLDREELQRQQREEKARLLAEATAAEEARNQAEAEAAAQAKLRLEHEREASRQALLQLEKAVDLNKNSLSPYFEMLRSIPAEHAPSSTDGMHMDDLQTGINDFKVGGSNVLEQFGLYMKVDDEEEEEWEPSGVALNDAPNDHTPNSVCQTNPDDLETITAGFKFQGYNQSEKIGLHVEVNEEEDEGDPSRVMTFDKDSDEQAPSSIDSTHLDDLLTGKGTCGYNILEGNK